MFPQLPECLKDLIGMHARCNAGKPAPKTGLYVDDLPGINFEVMTHIADRDVNETADVIFDRLYDVAIREMTVEIIDQLATNAQLTVESDLHAVHIGWLDRSIYHPTANLMRGIRLRKKMLNAPMQRICIDTVSVLTNSTGTATITIYEKDKAVFSGSATVLPGDTAIIEVGIISDSTDIKILMPNNQLATADTLVTERSNLSSRCCGGCDYMNDRYLEIDGWNGAGNDPKTFGLSADVRICCDASKLFCTMSATFGMALRYKMGAKIAEFARFSTRVNSSVNNPEYWQALEERFSENYQKHLGVLVETTKGKIRTYDKTCVNCTGARVIATNF